jgi:hypothetical protein
MRGRKEAGYKYQSHRTGIFLASFFLKGMIFLGEELNKKLGIKKGGQAIYDNSL